jgi:5'-3' exonuclease
MVNDLQKVFSDMKFIENENSLTLNSRVLVVDGLNTFLRNYAAIPSMDENGNHIGGTHGFLKSLGYAIRNFKPTRVVVVFDGKGGSERRRKLFPNYKSQRKAFTRLNRPQDFTTVEQDAENMKFQLVTLMQILQLLPITTIQIDGVEADDVMAYIALHVQSLGNESIIYSTDKDFIQLVGEGIKVFNPVKKKTFTAEIVQEVYQTHPNNFVFYRALMGDKSDNIDGVRGAGEKTLHKLIPELSGSSVTVDYKFIEDKYTDSKKKPKLIENILSNESIINRNLQLMDLRQQQMSANIKINLLSHFNQTPPIVNKTELTKAMLRAKIMSSFTNYDEWLSFSFLPLQRFYVNNGTK